MQRIFLVLPKPSIYLNNGKSKNAVRLNEAVSFVVVSNPTFRKQSCESCEHKDHMYGLLIATRDFHLRYLYLVSLINSYKTLN